MMEAQDFWDNADESTKLMKESKALKDKIEIYNELESKFEDISTLIEMGYEENDESLIPEIKDLLDDFIKTYDNLRIFYSSLWRIR